ncbi:hypothetical protein ACWKWU_00165 [Chitinophaga lutea]
MANPISLPVSFQTKPTEDVPLLAFAFDQKGTLIEKVAVVKGKADFKKLELPAQEYRFLIAAQTDKTDKATSLKTLQNLKAYEPVPQFDPKGNIRLLPIPENFLKLWIFRQCRVRGKLIKAFSLHGITEDKPVCHARVHICEVDKLLILLPRIPDYIIRRIPEFIFNPEIPIPLPQPGPDPDPIGPVINPVRFDTTVIRPLEPAGIFNPAIAPGPAIRKDRAGAIRVSETAKAQVFPAEVTKALSSGNVSIIRKTLLDNIDLFHPIFCRIPFLWPYFYRYDEIRTVYTDNFGRFDTEITYSIFGDHPDLYFWVEYFIDGAWTTVYRPGVACHTYWDFACGSEVTIRITDERVPWRCDSILGGSVVWVKTVGQSTSVSRIRQTPTLRTIQGVTLNEQGLTDVSLPYSPNTWGGYRRPFSGGLTIRVQFSFNLPNNSIKYYRWSARKLKHADLSDAGGAWMPLNNPVAKAYAYSYMVGSELRLDGYENVPLGPVTVGTVSDLFKIPPVYPPATAGQLYPWWTTGQDTYSVSFDTNALDGDGLYELKMELFNQTGALATVAPDVWQVPHPDTFSPHIDAPAVNLNTTAAGAVAYKLKMRVDNNAPDGEIYKLQADLDGDGVFENVSPDCCGFVAYNGAIGANKTLRISFRAYQPQNFADFSFGVTKGTCGDTPASDSGMVIASTAKYTRNGFSVFAANFSPEEMLGKCSEKNAANQETGKAAFAQVLHIQPLAVNGTWQTFGNVGKVAAFALEPQ